MHYEIFRRAVWAFIDMAVRMHESVWNAIRHTGLSVSDKDLHFWIFGAVGALLFAVSWRLFWHLRRHPGAAAFLFSMTAIALLALAVEMGQQITGTGAMELSDIAADMAGFLACSGAVLALVLVFLGLRALFRRGKKKKRRG